MTDENHYTAPDGTKYVAESVTKNCNGCAFNGRIPACMAADSCLPFWREDNRNIIWIKEQ